MNWILLIVVMVGHVGVWTTVFNQIHATACPRVIRKLSEIIILMIVLLPFLWFVPSIRLGLETRFSQSALAGWPGQSLFLRLDEPLSPGYYGTFCVAVAAFLAGRWLIRKVTSEAPAAVMVDRSQLRNLAHELAQTSTDQRHAKASLLHGWFARSLGLIPCNQILLADIRRLELELDVPAELDGFRICHLSDLHFTGQIDQRYFQAVVGIANEFQPQLTLLTGDLLDKDRCIPWIAGTLGQLRAELGCYFVLGNHDLQIKDQAGYLAELNRCGLKRADCWITLSMGQSVIRLAGNELPWYRGAAALPQLGKKRDSEFRLLLTHSPDQFAWAQRYGFDLILAGHNHGGQIRFPVIGPVVVPSRFGVKYASGTFQQGGSILHVSRGISGDEPIRILCPPEIGLITIRSSRR